MQKWNNVNKILIFYGRISYCLERPLSQLWIAKYYLYGKYPDYDALQYSIYNYEGNLLRSINHPNVSVYRSHGQGLYKDYDRPVNQMCAIVMKDSFKEDLFTLIELQAKQKQPLLSLPHNVYLFKEVLKTCIDLNANRILHCDLKSENILVSSDRTRIKLIDFGCAIQDQNISPQIYRHTCKMAYYHAPEILENYSRLSQENNGEGSPEDYKYFSEKSEVFALGCLLFQLIFLRNPFKLATSDNQNYHHIYFGDYAKFWLILAQYPIANDPIFQDLLNGMLCYDPEKRLTFAQVMSHKFLN